MHKTAAQGFEKGAEIYEKARPSYPEQAIQFIAENFPNRQTIVDLGAGTGKFTRLLTSLNAGELIAIEPVRAMREKLKTIPQIHRVLDGTAENIELEDNSVDILFCAQAFHWFANHQTLAEINRILKPNAFLILIWNEIDFISCSSVKPIINYIDSFNKGDVPAYKTMKWKESFENQTFFQSLEHKTFPNVQRTTRDALIERVLSISFISVLSSDEQRRIRENLEKRFDLIEEIPRQGDFDFFYLTNIYWCSTTK